MKYAVPLEEAGVRKMSGKNQILMVEETEADRAALREILESDYEIIEAESVKQALAILNAAAEPDEFSAVLLHFYRNIKKQRLTGGFRSLSLRRRRMLPQSGNV